MLKLLITTLVKINNDQFYLQFCSTITEYFQWKNTKIEAKSLSDFNYIIAKGTQFKSVYETHPRMHSCTCMYTYTHTHKRIHTHTYACAHTHACTKTHKNIHKHTHLRTHTNTHDIF